MPQKSYSAEKTADPDRTKVEMPRQLSPAAESKDPHSRGNDDNRRVYQGCRGVDLDVTSVKITRFVDRGKIGIHAKVKNRCNGRTDELIRVVFRGWPGDPHVWIHGGLGRNETKGAGVVTDDNENHNRAIGPVTVQVNPGHEISESNYGNNECGENRLVAAEAVSENSCR